MNLWVAAERVWDACSSTVPVLYTAIGLGCARGCLAWVFNAVRFSGVGGGFYATAAQYVVGAGEATMFLLLAFYARPRVLLRRSSLFYNMPFWLLPLGIGFISLAGFVEASFDGAAGLLMFFAGCAMAAAGYAVLLTLWIESMATLPPRQALGAFSAAYFVNILFWLVCSQLTAWFSAVVCIACTLFATVLLVGAERVAVDSDVPVRAFPRKVFSPRLLLWIVVIALAFGVGEGSTAMGYATVYAKVGMGLPELLVLLGLMLPLKRFDVGVFCRLTTVLVSLGLAGVFFVGEYNAVSQIFLSSSVESLQMFAITVACFTARQHRASAAGYGALVMGLFTLCVRLGQVIWQVIPEGAGIVYAVLLAAVVVLSIALLKEDKFDSQLHLDRAPRPNEEYFHELAVRRKLGKREESVFLLLLQGSSYDQIGEDLFMAPSTVRAHASRIFKKFGVHTRQELCESVQPDERPAPLCLMR